MASVPFRRGFGGINSRYEVKKVWNIRFKTVIFGRQKSEDLDSDELGKVRGFGRGFGICNNTN